MSDKPRHSKRYGLSKLDPQWREKIFASLHSQRLKLAVAVLSCSGCRPAELERGVIVRFHNNQLQLGIYGSKVDAQTGRGQPVRLLVVDQSRTWAQFLISELCRHESRHMTVKYDAGGISQRLREKSREIWPRRKTLISGYTYRHFMGKSMKESGETAEKIAVTLGHASDFSQGCYGLSGSGKRSAGQHGILAAGATNPVRHSPKTDRLERFIKPVEKNASSVESVGNCSRFST